MSRFNIFSHKGFLTGFFLLLFTCAFAQDEAFWVTAWNMNTPAKVDSVLSVARQYGFDKVFLQTRYRGDALYTPNRKDSTYSNPDSLCYLLWQNKFDPLAYAIEKVKNDSLNIGIYAWVTTFVATPHDLRKITPGHVYYTHPEWFLRTRGGKVSAYNEYEGAFLDPALPQVRDYLIKVFSDIVVNYDLAGIQLDYVRYPDSIFGWNEYSLALEDSLENFDFSKWKMQKINSFVNYAYISLKSLKPRMEISVAVVSDTVKGRHSYSQDWIKWLNNSYIDRVYVMAYNTSNRSFADLIKRLSQMNFRDKMTIVVRSWREFRYYHVSKINDKLKILKKYHFNSVGFYNYSGLIENNYLPFIRF